MNKIITILTTICCSFFTYANTITVSNSLNSPGQYTDLQVAIDAATTLSGDTILVAGSQSHYGSIVINDKELHLIGIGYDSDKQSPFFTEIVNCQFETSITGSTSSGSSIEGFKISSVTFIGTTSAGLTNVTIKRCEVSSFTLTEHLSGIFIYNNIFYDLTKSPSYNYISNIIVANNIIRGGGMAYSPFTSGSNQVYPIGIKNNVFINSNYIYATFNGHYSNNIFYGTTPNVPHSFSDFLNNLSYATSNNNFNISGTNSGSGNLVGQNPNFVSAVDYNFDYTDDYHFPSTSPAYNAGTDGTDLGIYGGTYPWPDGGVSIGGFMYSQEPQFPQVNEMNIYNTTIPVGGTLNVISKGIVNH